MVSIKLIIAAVLIIGFLAAGGGTFAISKLKTAKGELSKLRTSTERALATDRKMEEEDVG